MNAPRSLRASDTGTSLIEVLLAMGVLAVVLPLVFAVLARSGHSAAAAQAETRCVAIIPACLDEIEAAHAGAARFLPQLTRGQPFPATGDVLALAFAADGSALGRVEHNAYRTGLATLGDHPIRYFASLQAEAAPARPDTPALRHLRVTLEYPAAAPLAQRHKLDFHSRIP